MSSLNKQYAILNDAYLLLEKHGCERKIAELLLQHHLNVGKSDFYMMMHEEVSSNVLNRFQADLKRHVETGIPIQHLLGYEMFYGRKYVVNEDVLIPRPETEELVEHVIQLSKQHYSNDPQVIVDVGTGSGVIAITLALEIPDAIVYATDISEQALLIAKQNAKEHKAEVHFLQGDFLEPIINEHILADVIVSNPPYISRGDKKELSRTVADFDPHLALFADDNGLAAYQQIIQQLPKVAEKDTFIAFEIGYTQVSEICSLIKTTFPASKVETIKDISGKDRIISAAIM